MKIYARTDGYTRIFTGPLQADGYVKIYSHQDMKNLVDNNIVYSFTDCNLQQPADLVSPNAQTTSPLHISTILCNKFTAKYGESLDFAQYGVSTSVGTPVTRLYYGGNFFPTMAVFDYASTGFYTTNSNILNWMNTGTNPWSFAFSYSVLWSPNNQIIWSMSGANSNQNAMKLLYNSNSTSTIFRMYNSSGTLYTTNLTLAPPYFTGKYAHIIVCYDGAGNIKTYLDGVKKDDKALTAYSGTFTYDRMILGSYRYSSTFQGSDTALTAGGWYRFAFAKKSFSDAEAAQVNMAMMADFNKR